MATDRYDRRMPPVSPWYGHLWEIHQEAALTGAQVHQLWRRFGEDWLLTALVPKRLSRVLLTSVVPLRPASELVASGRRWLWAFVAVASLVSLTLAGLIARGLLWPLAAVGGGVAAIARRDFAHRVPVVASDELGQLGELFNQVLAGMADLEVAQTVQASLFPSATVEAGGVRVYGSTRPMTQLGGDYFDLSVLPDGRLLLLIGDVSGHGVPAALVMTMAKALVTARVRVHAGAQLLTPADVLRFLQQHLFRAARLRGMLTCLVAIHDPVRQCLDLANAGHAHPCRFRPGSPPSLLPLPASLPLAPRRRATFVTHEVPVLAGDRLLFYTDGLIEAHAADGQPLGYDRPFAAADALIDDDPVASCERLWAWERRQTAGAPPEDDITLLLLSRPAGGGECPRAATDGERSAGGGFE